MTRSASIIVLVTACLLCCHALPDGAPEDACENLAPKHGKNLPQTTPSPYKLIVAKASGDRLLRVTITGSNETEDFKGFLVAAEDASGKRIAGKVVENSDVKGLSCDSQEKSAATHVDNSPKKSISYEWQAPAGYKGPVIFRGSVAQTGKIFWVDIKSERIQM